MIIKKYEGATETEAVMKAKEELGSEAIVMNVKTIKPKGVFKLFKSTLVEITAALEEEKEHSAQEPAKVGKEKGNFADALDDLENLGKKSLFDAKIDDSVELYAEPKNKTVKEESYAIEERLNSLQKLLEKQMETKEHVSLREEKSEKEENSKAFAFIQLIYNTLLMNEVDEKYANQIIEEIEKTVKNEVTLDHILSNVYQKIVLKMGSPSPVNMDGKKTKVIYFIGPTGVGKTTTIAKIASRFKVDENQKIALLTTDTYRISAAEQLRTYANILDVPFKVIYTPKEIENTVEEFREYDLILIDTAGHSHRNAEQKEELQKFIGLEFEKAEKEIYLVVSATTKYKDLIGIADSYSECGGYKLIFTKLDETTALGNILNLRMYTGAELSYTTGGQDVPEDIELLNAQFIVKQLLGGK